MPNDYLIKKVHNHFSTPRNHKGWDKKPGQVTVYVRKRFVIP